MDTVAYGGVTAPPRMEGGLRSLVLEPQTSTALEGTAREDDQVRGGIQRQQWPRPALVLHYCMATDTDTRVVNCWEIPRAALALRADAGNVRTISALTGGSERRAS
jgi:hypothetical protein